MSRDRLLTALAAVALLLVITNIVLYSGNRTRQAAYAARAQYIQQGLQLEPLYQALVRGIVERAASTNDGELRALLAAQGINYTLAPAEVDNAPASANGDQEKNETP
jgi:type VI protein secretion system component VasK